MVDGTMSSDLISPEIVKGLRLVDAFIYLRSLSSQSPQLIALELSLAIRGA